MFASAFRLPCIDHLPYLALLQQIYPTVTTYSTCPTISSDLPSPLALLYTPHTPLALHVSLFNHFPPCAQTNYTCHYYTPQTRYTLITLMSINGQVANPLSVGGANFTALPL
jgi:hypothetical protein